MNDPTWQRAEDSFLEYFCKIERFSWGSFYWWEKGQDWPKFNFIRVTDPAFSSADLESIIKQFRPRFLEVNRTFSVKVPSSVHLSKDVMDRLRPAGVPITSLQYTEPNLKPLGLGGELHLCKSADELKIWWEINSDGRSREGESPLWPVLVEALNKGSRFFYLTQGNISISCGALTRFRDGQNLWGLATRKDFQRKSWMKELVAMMLNEVGLDVYLQVNQDSFTHRYFKTLPGVTELITETRYELSY